MKVNILEAYFNNPEQARRKREQQQAKSSTEKLASSATAIYNQTVMDILNKVIEKNDICILPEDFLTSHLYYDIKSYTKRISDFRSPVLHRQNDTKITGFDFSNNTVTLTVSTEFKTEYSNITSSYSQLPVNFGGINDRYLLKAEDIEGHKEYFIKRLQYYLEKETTMGNIPDYGESMVELFNTANIKLEKINLFTGTIGDLYIVPTDRAEDRIFDKQGNYISTDTMKYARWGALTPMRVMKLICEYFTFDNGGKVYLQYTHANDGEADMKTIKSPKLFKDVENFVKTAVTMSNKGFVEWLLGVVRDMKGPYTARQDPDAIFIPMRNKVQFLKLTTERQNAVDNNQFTVDKIVREIVTPNALLNVNKMTGDLSAGEDFESLNPDITVNAILYITLAGVKEEIGVRYIIDNKSKLPNPQKYNNTVCSDMGINSLHLETRDIEGMKRHIYAFSNNRFPWLSASSNFSIKTIELLRNRRYAIDFCLDKEDDRKKLKDASESLAILLYFDATETTK